MLLLLSNVGLLHYNNRSGLNVAICAGAPTQEHTVANLDFTKRNGRRAFQVGLSSGKANNARAIRNRDRNLRPGIGFEHQIFFVD